MDAAEAARRHDDDGVAGGGVRRDLLDDLRRPRHVARGDALAAQIGGEPLGIEAIAARRFLGMAHRADDDLVGVGERVGEIFLEHARRDVAERGSKMAMSRPPP